MEIKTFTEMYSDRNVLNFNKLKYKFGDKNLNEYIETLKKIFYHQLPLLDFKGCPVVLLPSKVNLTTQLTKFLAASHSGEKYGIQAMEDEIISTLSIEQIDSTRESVRRILKGGAPNTGNEDKAYGIKRGLDFISDVSNRITEANLFRLYMLAVGDYLSEEDRLLPEHKYRHGPVYVAGQSIVHQGLDYKHIPVYIEQLISYINEDDDLDQIIKSVIIHYYIAYLHPYFDGNGRIARLMQLWYMVQKGYTSSLYIPFSAYINENKGKYYKAFELITENHKVSGMLDVTPFVSFFKDNVFIMLNTKIEPVSILQKFEELIKTGEITTKEKDLFNYVLSAYGTHDFSTKQLEKDFQNAAYATIRSFVLKFEHRGLLSSQKYGSRVRYRVVHDLKR